MLATACRVIGTKDTPPSAVLEALLRREGIAYTLELWSFRWWYCPFCGEILPSNGATSPYRVACVECGEVVNCTREDCVPYITRSDVQSPPETKE